MIKAVIFDFNGTLYYDRDINLEGWAKLYKYFCHTTEGLEEFNKKSLLHNNRTNIIRLLHEKNIPIDEKTLTRLSRKKETYYHEIAIEKMRFDLASGVPELLDYLKQNNIKVNMCTASIKYNVDFYFEMTGIGKWFDKEIISYDDGKCDSKVAMYKKACKNIDVLPHECIVFEDSANGISDAIKAGYQKIIYVNHYHLKENKNVEVKQEIHNYSELDYSIFM